MRKLLIGTATAAAILLAGCDPVGNVADAVKKAQEILAQVQAGAVKACGAIPSIETIVAILAAGNSTVQTVIQVVDAVCNAIGTVAAPIGAAPVVPTVNGVPVVYWKVR